MRVLLAVLSGALACLSFPKCSISPLIFISMVPLIVAVRGRGPHTSSSLRAGFALGWLTGVVGFTGAFPWVLPTIARFENISTILALPLFVLFVAYYALQIALFAAGVAWISAPRPPIFRLGGMRAAFTAAWWVLLEWGFPKIIPWSFGDTLAASRILRQGADVGGIYGLSFLIMSVNACCAAALTKSRVPLGQRLRPVGVAVALVLVAALYGVVRLREFGALTDDHPWGFSHQATETDSRDAGLTVAVIQGGLPSGRKDLVAANEDAWATYSSLSTESGARNADLLIWPETVLRVYLRQDDSYRARVVDLVRRIREPVFVGSLDLPTAGPGELNSGYLVDGDHALDADTLQIYHKLTLLPFGEYVPGATWFPILRRWQTTGRFVTGEPSRPLTLTLFAATGSAPSAGNWNASTGDPEPQGRVTTFGTSICFEAVWPGAFNNQVRQGAEFLINLTDDGWFGDTAGPYQHLQAATLRAVETRRWLVRASNSGVTAFIDPTGRIVASLPLGTVGVSRQRIERSQELTFYVRWGNWPTVLCLAICLVASVRRVLASRALSLGQTADTLRQKSALDP